MLVWIIARAGIHPKLDPSCRWYFQGYTSSGRISLFLAGVKASWDCAISVCAPRPMATFQRRFLASLLLSAAIGRTLVPSF